MKPASGASPLACNMSALTPDERTAHELVTAALFRDAQAISDLPNGLALRFSNETPNLLRAAEFIAREQQCCPFLTFDLHVTPEKAEAQLDLGGPENVREFLLLEFADLLKGRSL